MDFTNIHNYYEHLVLDYMQTELIPTMEKPSSDFLLDVACYALSKLPSRYMRHEIDMAFYMSNEERTKMVEEVKVAVDNAYEYIFSHYDREE